MKDGPFTDEMIRHAISVVQTQHGIIKYMEGMARILAEAGCASNKAVGDSPEYAVRRWSDIVRDRALEILRETPQPKSKVQLAWEKECARQKEPKKLKSIPTSKKSAPTSSSR